jgi:hypothetical protein
MAALPQLVSLGRGVTEPGWLFYSGSMELTRALHKVKWKDFHKVAVEGLVLSPTLMPPRPNHLSPREF